MDEKYSVQINFAKPPLLVKGEGGKMYMTKKKKSTTKILQNMGGGVGPLEVSLFRVVMF